MEALNQSATPPSTEANINAVVQLEEEALRSRKWSDLVSDRIANFVGSMPFVAVHVAGFAIWAALNYKWLRFDPYPFPLLCMILSMEGVVISTFVLIKQNRMSQRADHRSHLDLQINLLAEKEVTKMLQMQRLICERLGISEAARDAELAELSHLTAVGNIAREVEHKMPAD